MNLVTNIFAVIHGASEQGLGESSKNVGEVIKTFMEAMAILGLGFIFFVVALVFLCISFKNVLFKGKNVPTLLILIIAGAIAMSMFG